MSELIDDFYPSPCPEWEEKLACMQQLDDNERAAVNDHLKKCDNCSATLKVYRQQNEAIRLLYAVQPLRASSPQLVRIRERRPWWNNVLDHSLSWRRRLGIAVSTGLLAYMVSQIAIHILAATPSTAIVLTLAIVVVLALSYWLISRTIATLTQHETHKSDCMNSYLPPLESTGGTYSGLAQKSVAKMYRNHLSSAYRAIVVKWQQVISHKNRRKTTITNVRRQGQRREILLTLLLSLFAIFGSLLPSLLHPTNTAIRASTIGGELIGISDGRYAFDIHRPDRELKQSAAEKFAAGDINQAQTLWDAAIAEDTNDAEALIYREDQRVLASKQPHITLIVGTILTTGYIGDSRDVLQGAYMAQQEVNAQNGRGPQIVLLIANTGSDTNTANMVAKQIVQATQDDPSILGVMGWPTSDTAIAATRVLETAHIPLLSAGASSDLLTGISPYFFRVAPSDRDQAAVAARFVEEVLHAKRIVVFSDDNNTYSKTLSADFMSQLTNVSMLTKVPYSVGKPETIRNSLPQITAASPDLIYFAGYPPDLSDLLTHLPTCQSANCTRIMGGDGLYALGDYSPQAHIYANLYFTAFAYPDEWSILHLNTPSFFADYARTFDPLNLHLNSPYGYDRADGGAILAYDGMKTLITAAQRVSLQQGKRATPQMTRQALAQIQGSEALQGVGGQISFASTGNVQEKAVVVLSVDGSGLTHLEKVTGRFLKSN